MARHHATQHAGSGAGGGAGVPRARDRRHHRAPQITKQFGETLCKQGTPVSFVLLNGVTHTFAAKDSVGQALAWMGDRFRGAPAPSDCER